MIQSVNEAEQVLTSNRDTVKFADTDLRTGSANCFNGWLNHNEGTAQFNIVAGGIYEIGFDANITSDTEGVVGLALFADGVQLNGAEADAVLAAAGDYSNVSISKYIRVCGRGSVTLTVQSVPTVVYNGTSTMTQTPTIKNANISIKRYS